MSNPLNEGFLRKLGLAVALYRAGELMRNELDAKLSEYSVNFLQLNMLVAIASGSAHSPAAISRLLNVDPAVVTRTLTKLEARELIQRTRNQKDRRSVRISLTDPGLGILIHLCEAASQILDSKLIRLASEEYEQLRRLSVLVIGY
jgi:DNA-binding MarR family transcriptional regulator